MAIDYVPSTAQVQDARGDLLRCFEAAVRCEHKSPDASYSYRVDLMRDFRKAADALGFDLSPIPGAISR